MVTYKSLFCGKRLHNLSPMSEVVAKTGTVSRVDFEAWLHDFIHEIRNHLNGISLEATNIGDEFGASDEMRRLQMKVQICGAYLKLIRDGMAPETPTFHRTTSREILDDVKARGGWGERVVWPKEKEGLDDLIGVDRFQIATALEEMIRDAFELAAVGEVVTLSWAAGFQQAAIGIQMNFRPAGEYVPVEVARWGKGFDARVGGLLRRYRIGRLLEVNGGCAAWTYVKMGQQRLIIGHMEYSSMADVSEPVAP